MTPFCGPASNPCCRLYKALGEVAWWIASPLCFVHNLTLIHDFLSLQLNTAPAQRQNCSQLLHLPPLRQLQTGLILFLGPLHSSAARPTPTVPFSSLQPSPHSLTSTSCWHTWETHRVASPRGRGGPCLEGTAGATCLHLLSCSRTAQKVQRSMVVGS